MAIESTGQQLEHVVAQKEHATDEINELRKYIVEMMHSEMELMENIKQNEDNVDTVNDRIEQFKKSIRKEQSRNNELKRILGSDLRSLQLLEEKKILIEAKQKQFQDAIAIRSAQVSQLHQEYQILRAGMVGSRNQISLSNAYSEKLESLEASVKAKTETVLAKLGEPTCLDESNAERQKLRAKQRYIEQHSVQMGLEAKELSDRNSQLEVQLKQAHDEIQDLHLTVRSEEKEAELVRRRMLQDIACLKTGNERSSTKLKTKRKKLRSQVKNEIASLRRRITFVTSELEKAQMANEDIFSVVGGLKAEQDLLDSKLKALCEEIHNKEEGIAELEQKVRTFERGDAKFDASKMQQDLATKNEELQNLSETLREKEAVTQKQEAEIDQLKSKLCEMETQTESSTISDAEEHIKAVEVEIREHENQAQTLQEVSKNLTKNGEELEARFKACRTKNGELKKEITLLYDALNELEKGDERLESKLADQKVIKEKLEKAVQHDQGLHAKADEKKELLMKKKQQMEADLLVKEQNWKQKCLEEETKLKAKLQEWNDKILQAQAQLSAVR